MELRQFQKSLLQLKRASILQPNDGAVSAFLANVFFKLEKENEAFSCLQKALSLNPTYMTAHCCITGKFSLQERLEDLEPFYQEIANMIPDKKSIADLYFGCAESLVVLSENYPKALEMYSKAFEAHPLESGHHFQYALALYHGGCFEEAREQFEHVIKLDPTNNSALNNIAYLTYCLGDLPKALERFDYIIENGLEIVGTYSNILLLLYHMENQDEEVINRYRDLLKRNLGENCSKLRSMYEEAVKITQKILERNDINEETREFNCKKIEGLNLVISFIKEK